MKRVLPKFEYVADLKPTKLKETEELEQMVSAVSIQKYNEAKMRSIITQDWSEATLQQVYKVYDEVAQEGYLPAKVDRVYCLCFNLGAKDAKRAEVEAEEILNRAPGLTDAQRGVLLSVLGACKQSDKKIAQAIPLYQRAIRLGSSHARFCLARLFWSCNYFRSASIVMREGIHDFKVKAALGDAQMQLYLGIPRLGEK